MISRELAGAKQERATADYILAFDSNRLNPYAQFQL